MALDQEAIVVVVLVYRALINEDLLRLRSLRVRCARGPTVASSARSGQYEPDVSFRQVYLLGRTAR